MFRPLRLPATRSVRCIPPPRTHLLNFSVKANGAALAPTRVGSSVATQPTPLLPAQRSQMSAAVALCYSGAAGFHGVVSAPARQRSVVMETKAEMIELAKKLNPVVGYWDPLKLADAKLWGQDEEVSTVPCLWPPWRLGCRGGCTGEGALWLQRAWCRGLRRGAAQPALCTARAAAGGVRRLVHARRRAWWCGRAALLPAKLPAARLGCVVRVRVSARACATREGASRCWVRVTWWVRVT